MCVSKWSYGRTKSGSCISLALAAMRLGRMGLCWCSGMHFMKPNRRQVCTHMALSGTLAWLQCRIRMALRSECGPKCRARMRRSLSALTESSLTTDDVLLGAAADMRFRICVETGIAPASVTRQTYWDQAMDSSETSPSCPQRRCRRPHQCAND